MSQVAFCLECANYGKRPTACSVCGRLKTLNRVKLEKEAIANAYWRSLTPAQRREIKEQTRAAQIALEHLNREAGRADELNEYLRSLWLGLQKFKMDSCGHPPLDAKLKDLFGEWL